MARCRIRLKRETFARQANRCFLCGMRLPLQMHRVYPCRQGGLYDAGNVIGVCRECHIIVEGLTWGQLEALDPYGSTVGRQ